MIRTLRAARTALVGAVGAAALFGAASSAAAQRPLPRVGVAVQPRPPRPVGRAGEYPGPADGNAQNDPRVSRDARVWTGQRESYDPRSRYGPSVDYGSQRRGGNTGGSRVIYVPVPVQGGYGYSYGSAYPQGAYYYPQPSYGGVYDVNGRPLSSTLEPESPATAYASTPDLSGSPYSVTDEGMMVVDFPDAARRAFPSCAAQQDSRDPNGRPRTVFYQPTDYWMVLRPGQRGRVQGSPPAGAKACYAIDSVGRVVLRY